MHSIWVQAAWNLILVPTLIICVTQGKKLCSSLSSKLGIIYLKISWLTVTKLSKQKLGLRKLAANHTNFTII